MEPLPGCEESSEAYSYLSLDPQWGPVKKGGPWSSGDVATMGYIHKDFQEDPSLTEIIIRQVELIYLLSYFELKSIALLLHSLGQI